MPRQVRKRPTMTRSPLFLLATLMVVVQTCYAFAPSLSTGRPRTLPLFASNDMTPSTAFMITHNMKRILIEELGYSRKDVNSMRVEMAGPIVGKRIRCPPEGMPKAWYAPENAMMELEHQHKYPLQNASNENNHRVKVDGRVMGTKRFFPQPDAPRVLGNDRRYVGPDAHSGMGNQRHFLQPDDPFGMGNQRNNYHPDDPLSWHRG